MKLKFKKFGEINFEKTEKFYRDFIKTLFYDSYSKVNEIYQ